MKRWICKTCGYTHEGDDAPERCPQCNASKSQFYEEKNNLGCILCILFFAMMLIMLCFALLSCGTATTVDNTPVKSVELKRYLGKWYEVARFDHKFERGMMQCIATYTQKTDGSIIVTNQGKKEDGTWKTSVGKAKTTNEPGVLRVSFFGPFYSDYRILMLDSDYSYALVGGSGDNYLWVLSRTPQLKEDVKNKIIHEATRRGYHTNKLIWVWQPNDIFAK